MSPLSRREFTLSVLGTAAAAVSRAMTVSDPYIQTSPAQGNRSTGAGDALAALTLAEAAARIKSGAVTSTDLVNACLARIDIYNPKINAFITVMRDAALAQAKNLDDDRRAGRVRGPLHGIPIALKDNI